MRGSYVTAHNSAARFPSSKSDSDGNLLSPLARVTVDHHAHLLVQSRSAATRVWRQNLARADAVLFVYSVSSRLTLDMLEPFYLDANTTPNGPALVDHRLYLPLFWTDDAARQTSYTAHEDDTAMLVPNHGGNTGLGKLLS